MDRKEMTRADYDFESYMAQAMVNAINAAGGIPYMQVRTENIQGFIPERYDEGGIIVFNVSMDATPNLSICDGMVSLNVRFQGRDSMIAFPSVDVLSVYDHTTAIGMGIGDSPAVRPIVTNSRKGNSLKKAAEVSPKTIENVRRPLVRPGQIGTTQEEPTNEDAPVGETKSNVIHRDFGKNKKKD